MDNDNPSIATFSFRKSSEATEVDLEDFESAECKVSAKKKTSYIFRPSALRSKSEKSDDEVSESEISRSSSPTQPSIISSPNTARKRGLLEKILKDLHISPNLSPSDGREIPDPIMLPPTSHMSSFDAKSLFKDILHRKAEKKSLNEPDQKLCEKYGHCDSKVIGKGTTCNVRLVTCRQNGNMVYAVKEFRKKRKNESQKEYMKKMTSEFCISSSLHHPHIVQTLDLVVNDKHTWCEVMEYCGGGTLFDLLQDRKLMIGEVNCCYKQLLDGVHYIHSMGVAHRDLKPGMNGI
jgi:hypothetical protein